MDEAMEEGRWLAEHRADLDRGEALWLERLAGFDRESLWSLDGHLSCAAWLVWRTNMARSTAFEKLRVAHELERRPIIAGAFREGRLSYSAVRAITRMDAPDPGVDEALVELAQSGRATILDLERLVRSYMLYADQERAPLEDRSAPRDVRIRRGDTGTGQVVITLSDLEIEEFAATLQAFIDLRYRPRPVDESSAGDSGVPSAGARAVDESSAGDSGCYTPLNEAPLEEADRAARKADALMDMVNAALRAADGGRAVGDDRYLVHVVTRDEGRSFGLRNGSPLHPAEAGTVTCDTNTVPHKVTDAGEPLHLGRKTREWSTAQRRAINVRDGGHCRFPACQFAHYDIHHMQPWESGGLTDVSNGFCECRRHHRMLHAGYQVEGSPTASFASTGPQGITSAPPSLPPGCSGHPGGRRSARATGK